MSMLIDENFPENVTSGYEDPVTQLFVPLLSQAIRYDVAVGYFTSGWMRDTAVGLAQFSLRGGRSRWIVSPNLDKEDADVIVASSDSESSMLSLEERHLVEMIRALQLDTRRELCSLIAANVLEFRIAVPKDLGSPGMLHAKIGTAVDEDNNSIGFSGSYNLTANAKFNWENIDIFKSWIGNEASRVDRLKNRFENLWGNQDSTYETFVPSESLVRIIKREAGSRLEEFEAQLNRVRSKKKELRDYQLHAIQEWGKNNGRGTYVMATGSGKTVTALATIEKLIKSIVKEKGKALAVVIVLPLKHLVDQWYKEVIDFGLTGIRCYESSETWDKLLTERLSAVSMSKKGYLIALVTNATFSTEHFQKIVEDIKIDFLMVADEAHNLGSENYLEVLPNNANFRLALSATPERHNDVYGTQQLFEYFGKAVIEFSLEDAINAGFLCPYSYHAHLCRMSDEEYEEYLNIASRIKIESERPRKGLGKSTEQLRLEGKRADLITRVESKLEKLEKLLELQRKAGSITHTLVYCGSRRGENSERHIERTVRVLGALGIKVRKFTSAETTDDRQEILKLFSSGQLDAIAAIKCLDEGVDVPETRVAYILASTTNPREYIQRRGRVLRKAPGKDCAVIHDFIVAPPLNSNVESEILIRELERAQEFALLAMNGDECLASLKHLQELTE